MGTLPVNSRARETRRLGLSYLLLLGVVLTELWCLNECHWVVNWAVLEYSD
jgi:hypothetical protein